MYQNYETGGSIWTTRDWELGIQNFSSIILQHKIQTIIKNVKESSAIGKVFLVVLAWAKHQSGFAKPILESTKSIAHM